jgi:hypothetical protein
MNRILIFCLSACLLLISCHEVSKTDQPVSDSSSVRNDYASDKRFLLQHTDAVELQSGNSRVLVVPQYQGRVMTSSASSDTGHSFGWVNYDLISAKKYKEHINAYGGEERIWLAPEGGQFSFFFKKGVPYDFEHWYTPAAFDTMLYNIVTKTDSNVVFSKDISLVNRSGTVFDIHIDRKVSILNDAEIDSSLSINPDSGLHAVAYKTVNTLTNKGSFAWDKKTGAPAVWLLGMMKPSANSTIVLPLKRNPTDTGTIVHDAYFGKIPDDRWKIGGQQAFLKADGKFRGKVGIPPVNSPKYIGSYDADHKVLTILEAIRPEQFNEIPNSAWEDQKSPFTGDAFNAYNDGPLKDGSQMGPFYELESLSPAAFLQPGKSLTHTQITYHLVGNVEELDKISRQLLGVSLNDIQNAFGSSK